MLNPDGGIKHQKVAGSRNNCCLQLLPRCRADFSPLVHVLDGFYDIGD